jgi:hypothetical protein
MNRRHFFRTSVAAAVAYSLPYGVNGCASTKYPSRSATKLWGGNDSLACGWPRVMRSLMTMTNRHMKELGHDGEEIKIDV